LGTERDALAYRDGPIELEKVIDGTLTVRGRESLERICHLWRFYSFSRE